MYKRSNYFFEIIFLPILIIIFLVISITTYNIQITKEQLKKQITNKTQEYLENQKKSVYNKVQFINSSIKIENSKIESKLKNNLKEKIETAINISNDVYNENKKLSRYIIYQVLAKRLSFLKYNKNRGYYFIINKNNRFINHTIKRFNNIDMTTFLDKDNKNLINELRKSTKKSKISFVKYYFPKPGDTENEYLKLTAVTYFKPLDIIIGTGEYLDVVVDEMKENFLSKLAQNRDLSKSLSILSINSLKGGKKFAKVLFSYKKELVGSFLNDSVKDTNGNFYVKNYLKALREKGEGFEKYSYKSVEKSNIDEKLTYYYLNKEWNWIISSSFYLKDLDTYIKKIKAESKIYLKNLLSSSLLWGVVFLFVTILISLLIFYKIQKRIATDKDKLIKSEADLKNAQKISKMGSWSFDIGSEQLNWSDEIFEILELDKKEFSPSYELFVSFMPKNQLPKFDFIFSKTLKDKTSHKFIHSLKVKDKIKWVENQSYVFYDKLNNRYTMLGTIQDITEKFEKDKKIEDQAQLLYNQSKMAAMGEMIENIAHQWRQPLSAISISASALKLENEFNTLDEKKVDRGLDDILNNTKYLTNTIEDFRSYFVQNKEKKLCNISLVYEKCMKLLRPKFISSNIETIENIENIECKILDNELIQCFMNIFNNAYDALLKYNITKKLIFIKIYKEYDNVVISIKDNAGGIDEKIINKIFEPYFTTKHKSQGTGIGLYMTQEIISKHLDGFIKVSNEEYLFEDNSYKGANFKISIPLNTTSTKSSDEILF